MVYNSLTDAPRNLKEGIDWLLALKGTDAENNLAAMGAALYDFLVDKPVGYTEVPALEKVKLVSKEFLEQPELKKQLSVGHMLAKFNKPINKKATFMQKLFGGVDKCNYMNVVKETPLSAKTIAQKLGTALNGFEKFLEKITTADKYESAYSAEATWEASCSKKPEDCAAVFVGIAPMIWAGIRSLEHVCYTRPFMWHMPDNRMNVSRTLWSALGFKDEECLHNTSTAYVTSAVAIVWKELLTFYNLSGFWAFYDCTKACSVKAEPSVEPVKPEVDVEKPVQIAKAAKVARSVKAAKKAAKKLAKKARQKKEKRKQKQQESAEQ